MSTATEELSKAIEETTKALAAILKTASNGDIEADDAAAIEGTTRELLLQSVKDRLAAHLAASNPHGITLNALDAYSKEELLAKSGEGVPTGSLPVSFYGSFDTNIITCTLSGFKCKIPKAGCYIQGTSFDIPETTLDASGYPSQDKLRVYLRYRNGTLSYFLSTAYHAESPTVMYVGYLTTTTTAVTAAVLESVYRLGVYRTSETARGSALICSGGLPRAEDAVIDKNWSN